MPEMRSAEPDTGVCPLFSVVIAQEPDVVTARQRAKQLARLLGLDNQDQIRLATATSEIARNAFQYAGGGRVDFGINLEAPAPMFVVQVTDHGPGLEDVRAVLNGEQISRTGMGLGIVGTRRLMDRFSLESAPGHGTRVEFARVLSSHRLTRAEIERVRNQLAREGARNDFEELRQQNQELLTALNALQESDHELGQRHAELARLNQELEDTNRGVVALYAELDEKAEALRAANEIKTRFLSHMSHEFRTPLNAILALTGLLQRRVDGDLTPDQMKQVSYIRRAAEELSEMVNDLLDTAKVESGKFDLKPSRVDIGQLFAACRGMLRNLVTSEAVTLTVEEPAPALTMVTDEGKLGQIIRNLVSNALKFTERGEVRLSVATQNQHMIFQVRDTGIGIAPEDQQFVFKDFAQIDSVVQRRVKGTGLGLPLSRKLAELLGGTLTVESTPGAGSVFTLSLPRGEPDADDSALHEAERVRVEPDEPAPILIIDDEEIARYLVKQMFRGSKHRLIEAANASEGAERARFDRPALIVLDLTMPGRNGFEALDELKADPSTAAIPVVVHTSVRLRPEDLSRLAGRHAAVLPKQPEGREHAQTFIREVLGEPHLFIRE